MSEFWADRTGEAWIRTKSTIRTDGAVKAAAGGLVSYLRPVLEARGAGVMPESYRRPSVLGVLTLSVVMTRMMRPSGPMGLR